MYYPLVFIIILNYNGKNDTLEALASLQKLTYPKFKILVVDNGSKDSSVQAFKKYFPKIQILENSQNLGFAEGNNRGLKLALKKGADFVLLLNNDTIADPNFLTILMKNAIKRTKFSIFGPQMRYFSDRNRLWCGGGKLSPVLAAVKMIDKGKLAKNACFKRWQEVNFISGACLLVSRQVFEKIGFLDPDYFLYWEEADFEIRASKAGFKMMYVPDAVIWHKVSKTSGGSLEPLHQYYFFRNNLLFIKKNLPWYFWPSAFGFFFARILIVEIIWGFIQKLKGNNKRLKNLKYIRKAISDFRSQKFGGQQN